MTSLNCPIPVQVSCSSEKSSSCSPKLQAHPSDSLSSSLSLKPFLKELKQNPILKSVPKTIKDVSMKLVDAFVGLTFEFVDQPLLPSQVSTQSNFAPVEEMGNNVVDLVVNGTIPDDFPEGVYVRNGPNPLFGGLKTTKSVFGKSSQTWIEGEGMVHALYFTKDCNGRMNISYNNKYVKTDTFNLENAKKKPAFLPAIEGDSAAILSAYLLNWLRFGLVNKFLSNTSVFEHSGKFYSVAENHLPQEIDILTSETRRNWDVGGAWNGPFTSHPKKDPCTGELVVTGIHPQNPYFELGVISADGKKLLHKVDLKLKRCCLCHEIGVTERYNVILDFPVTLDINRLITGGPLIKYDKDGYARIGIMPRYGDADSLKWFEVKSGCTFHVVNCYEHDDEVIVFACRAPNSIIPGPDFGLNKFEWFSKGFKQIGVLDETDEAPQEGSLFSRVYEWRLNLRSGVVEEMNLTGTAHSMDFPIINDKFTGKENKYGYTQMVDSNASSIAGMAKYGGLAKLYFKERKLQFSGGKKSQDLIQVEYHKFPESTFCSGAAFVAKPGGLEEDDGWIIAYVHNEHSNTSQVYIVDAKKFSGEPIAKITLPSRVPYGFHGAFFPICTPR